MERNFTDSEMDLILLCLNETKEKLLKHYDEAKDIIQKAEEADRNFKNLFSPEFLYLWRQDKLECESILRALEDLFDKINKSKAENISSDEEKEITLMNCIIYGAIIHGGDSGGAYCCDANLVVPFVKSWLKFRGYDNKYKVSKNEWCFIIPIEQEDSKDYEDELRDKFYEMNPALN